MANALCAGFSAEEQIVDKASELKILTKESKSPSAEVSSLFIHTLEPKNRRQQVAIHWLSDPRTAIVFLIGAAGCGKTALAVAQGVKGIEEGLYDYILLTRVNVEAGAPVGFLKGDAAEKNSVWIQSMVSEFHRWIGVSATKRLMESSVIRS